MEAGVRAALPGAEIILRPMADGGEGTLDAILAAGAGVRHTLTVTGGHGQPIAVGWGALGPGRSVLEVAQVVGLTLPGMKAVSIQDRTTRGIGELIQARWDAGDRELWIGLGGSATNDGGAGLLAALGARYFDAAGHRLGDTPRELASLHHVDFSALQLPGPGVTLHVLADVNNPLLGDRGATAVYGPQKGVTPADAPALESLLTRLAAAGDAWAGQALSTRPGSGAAGGLGNAFYLLGATFHPGASHVAGLIQLDAAVAGADWVITGEGRSDAQTLHGKAPHAVAVIARRAGVPVTLLCGAIEPADRAALAKVFDDMASLVGSEAARGRGEASLTGWASEKAVTEAMHHARERLGTVTSRLARERFDGK